MHRMKCATRPFSTHRAMAQANLIFNLSDDLNCPAQTRPFHSLFLVHFRHFIMAYQSVKPRDLTPTSRRELYEQNNRNAQYSLYISFTDRYLTLN